MFMLFFLFIGCLISMEGLTTNTISKMGGVHQMLGLKDFCFAAVLRDSIQCPPEASAANKMGASFESPCGRFWVKPEQYMEMISSMKPNLWASLADEVPAWVSVKRNRTSVDRTLKWLDQCISLNPSCGEKLGAIVGGSSIEERQRCAEEVAERDVSGYWIGGFGFGESMETRPSLLDAVTGNLPDEKLRLISGLDLPGIFTISQLGALHSPFHWMEWIKKHLISGQVKREVIVLRLI